MQLEFKPDFEIARARWRRYWAEGCSDRPVVHIVLPKPGSELIPRPVAYHILRTNLDDFADSVLKWAASLEWLGEAIPAYQVAFAPDHAALLLGAEMEVHPDSPETVWIKPFLNRYDQEIRFQFDGKYWELTVACIRALRKRCDGRLIVFGPNLQGGLDALAAIRGAEQLLFDLFERPDDVKGALARIDRAVRDMRAALADELDCKTIGSVTRHGMYCSGVLDVPQCDFSAMVSPEMFREFGLPSLQHDCAALDAAEYHLDGPNAIRHLPAIAEIRKIRAIQWQPGVGNATLQDWSALYHQIDQLGLGQIRSGCRAEVHALWSALQQRHLLFIAKIDDIQNSDEASRFLDEF